MQMQIIIDRFLRSEQSFKLELTCYDRILMLMLASFMGSKDHCYPSYESLILCCGMSKKIISRSIKNLERLGILEVTRAHRTNNIYRFLSSHVELKDNSRVPMGDSLSSQTGGFRVPMGDGNNISNNINNNITSFSKNKGAPLLQEWIANRQKGN